MVGLLSSLGFVAAVAVLAPHGRSQSVPDHSHGRPQQTLFTARATASAVIPSAQRFLEANGTGALIMSADAQSILYRFTWDRLSSGPITAIHVHNFGRGGVGAVVATLCGDSSTTCPDTKGGTIEGVWKINAALARELAVERMYIDVHTTGASDGELRGQILAVPWMVHSEQFVVRLRHGRHDQPGIGTATVYLTPFPQGLQLQFDLTVMGLPDEDAVLEIRTGSKNALAGTLRIDGNSIRRQGGTISGVLRAAEPTTPLNQSLASALRSGKATLSVVVKGKLIGSGTIVRVM